MATAITPTDREPRPIPNLCVPCQAEADALAVASALYDAAESVYLDAFDDYETDPTPANALLLASAEASFDAATANLAAKLQAYEDCLQDIIGPTVSILEN
ncbi:MAG: hypothetical protein AAF483_14885 [Planctomycetota bacterium]